MVSRMTLDELEGAINALQDELDVLRADARSVHDECGTRLKKPWLQLRPGYAAARFSAVLFFNSDRKVTICASSVLTFRGQSGPNLAGCAVQDDGSTFSKVITVVASCL